MSLIGFLGWMTAYLFIIRYQTNQWTTLSLEDCLAYSVTHFPLGFLSEFQEEASYRGVLFGLVIPLLGAARANLFQATVFLLLHYVGVAHGHMDAMRSISTFLLGFIFCGFRMSSSNLLLPTLFHIIWNLISTFMYLSIEQGWHP